MMSCCSLPAGDGIYLLRYARAIIRRLRYFYRVILFDSELLQDSLSTDDRASRRHVWPPHSAVIPFRSIHSYTFRVFKKITGQVFPVFIRVWRA